MFKNLVFKNNLPQLRTIGNVLFNKKLDYLKLFAPFKPYLSIISFKRRACKGLCKYEVIFTINPKKMFKIAQFPNRIAFLKDPLLNSKLHY